MGTGKPGRDLNTHGNGRRVSAFALVHSDEGLFTKPSKPTDSLRLKRGGHGQNGMNLLDKYGIEYNIVRTYPNGVRVGNIPSHKDKNKQEGTNQSWFPKHWTPKVIRKAGEHVAGLKANRNAPSGKPIFGVYRRVRVGVIRTNGKIATIFPDSDQSSLYKSKKFRKRRRRKKK